MSILGNKLFGYLTLRSGYYQIEPDISGYHVLRRVETNESPGETDAIRLPGWNGPQTGARKSDQSGSQSSTRKSEQTGARKSARNGEALASKRGAFSDSTYTVDVLILYTKRASADIEWTSGSPDLKFSTWIDCMNQAISNSENNHVRFRLVRTYEVDYQQKEGLGINLANLQKPDDGLLDEAQILRSASGADFVVLVPARSVGTACGVAYTGEPDNDQDFGYSRCKFVQCKDFCTRIGT